MQIFTPSSPKGVVWGGFQKQNINGKVDYEDSFTICGLLELALKCCGALNYPKVTGSSRTDRGVHALCNTVHVDLDGLQSEINSFSIAKKLNKFFAYNDHDIRVLKVQEVADDFHCRHKVCERKYLYRLAFPKPGVPYREVLVIPSPISEHNRCWFLQNPKFDAEAVYSACNLFLGLKDFGSFCSKVKNVEEQPDTVRELNTLQLSPGRPLIPTDRLTEEYDFWDFTCSARSFLYHQVRRMVSALVFYGQGRVTKEDLQQMFDKPGNDSWRKINTMVPAYGLYLTDILYKPEDLAFSENLKLKELKQQEQEEETKQILEKLRNPETTVLEKIDLRKRLTQINQMTFSKQ